MSYMHCPNCGLSVHLRAPLLTLDCCPRCLARQGVPVPMHVSDHRSWPAAANGAASDKSFSQDDPDEHDHRPARPVDDRPQLHRE